jgi:hypothetical protein
MILTTFGCLASGEDRPVSSGGYPVRVVSPALPGGAFLSTCNGSHGCMSGGHRDLVLTAKGRRRNCFEHPVAGNFGGLPA